MSCFRWSIISARQHACVLRKNFEGFGTTRIALVTGLPSRFSGPAPPPPRGMGVRPMPEGESKDQSLQPAIRVVMMPRDANYLGTIFGGVILSSIDLAGAVEAQRHTDRKLVTVAMHEVKFL